MNDGKCSPFMNAGHPMGRSSRRLAELLRGLGIVVWFGMLSLALPSRGQSAAGNESLPSATTNAPSKFLSPEDGWLDVSGFLDETYGFVPIVMPITEPAVGYGAAGGLAFIDKPQGEAQAGFGRPNITAVGGLGTENGTWGVVGADVRHWLDDRLQTQVGFAYASVNLKFYGIGEDAVLQAHPLSYNLEPLGGLVQAKYRLGQSRFWVGLSYAIANTQVGFDAPDTTPGLPSFQGDSRVGGLTPSFTYDSRDNMFTPTRGNYAEVSLGAFSQALGGDSEFQRVKLMLMQFVPLHQKLTLGVRGTSTFSFGGVPFYLRPFVSLRGVQAMRYQGDNAADVEAELRWQFWKRFSLVGFGGGGVAWNDFERFDRTLTVVTGGTGFRYELARKYGLHMGMDVAFGPDNPVFYVQFGSAWIRP
jgi:outer membrane protein assembly factor BamA